MSSDPIIDSLEVPRVLGALSAGVSIVTLTPDGRLQSRAAVLEADCEAEAPDLTMLAGSTLESLRDQLDRAAAGSVERWEGWLTDAAGQARYLRHVFAPAPDREANGILVVTQDLTAQKARERDLIREIEALRDAEAATAAVVASSLDCVVIVDAEGLVVEFNPAAVTTFGYARMQAIGQPVADLIVPPSMREHHRHGMERYQRTGVPHVLNRRVEFEAMRADGSLFPVELSIVELRGAKGRFFAAHLRDLTIAKAAQREIERQRLQLHLSEKYSMMASLLSGVAHELNNPMAILLAQATLLQSRAESDDARARAGKIHRAAERAARIVKSFLTMTRERPLEQRPTHVRHVVESAIDMTAYGRRGAEISLLTDWESGSRLAVVDAPLLGQVVTTLLIHATHAFSARPGDRTIWLSTRGGPENVVFELAHNGSDPPPGVSSRPEAVAVSPLESWSGLSISREILAANGGTLTVGARDGGGVKFTVTLPAAPSGDDDRPGEGPSSEGLSILIVDDEKEVAEALADMLEIIGHRTTLAHDAAEALTRAGDRSIDLVFADLRMPVISGIELYHHLTERRPELEGRFVLVTGDTVGAFDALRHGAPGGRIPVLEKPFSIRDVRAVLERALVPEGSSRAVDRNGPPTGATSA